MSKLYGQAAYQGQRDDDDPMPKSRLKRREENQWRKDWSHEWHNEVEEAKRNAFLRDDEDYWEAKMRQLLPADVLVDFSRGNDSHVPAEVLKHPVSVAWSEVDGMYVAATVEYPELSFADDTVEDAIAGLKAIAYRYIMSSGDGVAAPVSEGWL